MRSSFFHGLIAVAMLAAHARAQAFDTPEEVLTRIRDAMRWSEHSRMTVNHTTDSDENGGRLFSFSTEVSMDRDRMQRIGTGSATTRSGEKVAVWSGDWEIQTPDFRIIAEQEDDWTAGRGTLEYLTPEASSLPLGEKEGSLFGYLSGMEDKHICDVLATSDSLEVASDTVAIDGRDCILLKGTTEYGDVEVAVASDLGFYPVRYTVVRRGEQRNGTRDIQAEGVTEMMTVYALSEFEVIENELVPVHCLVEHRATFDSGIEDFVSRREIRLSDVEIDPVFPEGTFTLAALPDGIILSDAEVSAVRFITKDGKAEPYVSTDLAIGIDRAMLDVAASGGEAAGVAPAETPSAALAAPVDTPVPPAQAASDSGTSWRVFYGALIVVALVLGAAGFLSQRRAARA